MIALSNRTDWSANKTMSVETEQKICLDARQRAMLAEMGVRVWLPGEDAPRGGKPSEQAQQVLGKTALQNTAATAAGSPAVAQPLSQPLMQPAQTAVNQQQSEKPRTKAAHSSAAAAGQAQTEASQDVSAQQPVICQSPAYLLPMRLQAGVDEKAALAAAEGLPRWLFVLDVSAAAPEGHAQGEPHISGHAGQLLLNMAAAVRLRYGQVYGCRVAPSAPLAGRQVGGAELQHYADFLRREIARLQPQVVVAMGRYAAMSLLNTQTALGQLLGKAHRMAWPESDAHNAAGCAAIPVVVTYPLAYLLRNPQAKRQAWQDLCMAHALAQQTPGGLPHASA